MAKKKIAKLLVEVQQKQGRSACPGLDLYHPQGCPSDTESRSGRGHIHPSAAVGRVK
jgi:hypothetical protein